VRRAWILSFLLFSAVRPGRAQEHSVGGHAGFVFPLVARAGDVTTTINDVFVVGMPVGISVKGSGRMFFDFEFVPLVRDRPRLVTLTVHPGLIWRLGHGWGVGMRAAFDVNTSQVGFTPLINKSWPIEHSFFKSYFAEADFVVRFNRPIVGPSTNLFAFALHFGVGF
jgi:hypothetical protein